MSLRRWTFRALRAVPGPALLVAGLYLLAPTQDADAFGACGVPGCPSPVHPCCCPSPCPVNDGEKNGILEEAKELSGQIEEQIGTALPSMDTFANPLACVGDAGIGDLTSAAQSAGQLGDVGRYLGDSGFTQIPGFNIGSASTLIPGANVGLDTFAHPDSLFSGTLNPSDLGTIATNPFNGSADLGGFGADLDAIASQTLNSVQAAPFASGPINNMGDLARAGETVSGGLSTFSGMPGFTGVEHGAGIDAIARATGADTVAEVTRAAKLPDAFGGLPAAGARPSADAGDAAPSFIPDDVANDFANAPQTIGNAAADDLNRLGERLGLTGSGHATTTPAPVAAPSQASAAGTAPTGDIPGVGRLVPPDVSQDFADAPTTISQAASNDLSEMGEALGFGSGSGGSAPSMDPGTNPLADFNAGMEGVSGNLIPDGVAQDFAAFPDVVGGAAADDLAKLGDELGFGSLQDLGGLMPELEGTGLDVFGDIGGLQNAVTDIPGLNSMGDLQAIPETLQLEGVGDLAGLTGVADGLTKIPGVDGLGQISDLAGVGGLADIQSMATMTGLPSSFTQPAQALSGLANCASASTPVSPAMMDSAGWLGMIQAKRNALAGPGGENTVKVDLPDADLRLPQLVLPDEALPSVNARTFNPEAGMVDAETRVFAGHYTTRMTPEARAGARDARRETVRRTATIAYGRAVAKRYALATETIPRIARNESRIQGTLSFAEDVRINSEIKAEVAQMMSELAELQNLRLQVRAARALVEDASIVSANAPAARPARPAPETGYAKPETRLRQRARAFIQAVRDAGASHNDIVTTNDMTETSRPQLVRVVKHHEALKSHVVGTASRPGMENEIRAALSVLYVNPDEAWARLRTALRSQDATGYTNGNRAAMAVAAARALLPELIAQTAETRFGARRENPDYDERLCERSGGAGAHCYEFTVGPHPDDGRARIDAYYGSRGGQDFDPIPYKITRAFGRQARPDEPDNDTPGEDDLFQAMQYYLEAVKRKEYWDPIRRGGTGDTSTMTDRLWNELADQAPGCFAGPMPATRANLGTRPEVFDVSPDCGHRFWSDGTAMPGALINHQQLGGVDASIWMIDNAELENDTLYGGTAARDEALQKAKEVWAGGTLATDLDEAGFIDLAAKSRRAASLLPGIEAGDTVDLSVIMSHD